MPARPPPAKQPILAVGRYALYDELAAGGMATVHIGRLVEPVGFSRTVAIKRLHAQFAKDPEFVDMFLDEARVAARIRHPNVVQTVDVVAAEGELFLVMDYVHGESLSRLLRASGSAKIPLPHAATIVSGLLHGLHAAHEAKSERGEPLGIVHRDVSPQNVLVGVDGVPRVLDFGIAKAAGRLHSTRDGLLKGKIAYMAPEQVSGEVTRRTDVFAASLVLWELLAGRRLFDGENDVQRLDQVLHAELESPAKFRPGLPPALAQVVMRGLCRDPAARWESAREMARALERCLPLTSASELGEWVEKLAGQALQKRTNLVDAIEYQSAPTIDANPLRTGSHAILRPPTTQAAEAAPAERASEEAETIVGASRADSARMASSEPSTGVPVTTDAPRAALAAEPPTEGPPLPAEAGEPDDADPAGTPYDAESDDELATQDDVAPVRVTPWRGLAAGALALTLVSLAFVLFRRPAVGVDATKPSATAAAPPTEPPAGSATARPIDAPTASAKGTRPESAEAPATTLAPATPSASASAPTTKDVAKLAPTTPHVGQVAPTAAPTTAPTVPKPSSKPDCRTKYTLKDGVKVWKPECF